MNAPEERPIDALPAPVADGWRALLELPAQAVDGLWPLIQVALFVPNDPANPDRLKSFAHEHEVAEPQVLAAIRTSEYLVRKAAARGLDTAAFRRDLEAISDGNRLGIDLLAPRYAGMREQVRAKILEDSLADHGPVLLGLEWRVDRMIDTNRGNGFNDEVVFLTLRYRHGDDLERMSLQVPPDGMDTLKKFFDEFARRRR